MATQAKEVPMTAAKSATNGGRGNRAQLVRPLRKLDPAVVPMMFGRQMKDNNPRGPYEVGWAAEFGCVVAEVLPALKAKDYVVRVCVNDCCVFENFRPTLEAATKTLELQIRKIARALRKVK